MRTVDLYGDSVYPIFVCRLLASTFDESRDLHDVRIVVTGTHSAGSTGNRVEFDSIVVRR